MIVLLECFNNYLLKLGAHKLYIHCFMLTLVVVAFHDIAAAAVNGNRLDVVKCNGHAPTQSQIINPMAPDLNPDWTDCSNSGRQAVMSPEILWNVILY